MRSFKGRGATLFLGGVAVTASSSSSSVQTSRRYEGFYQKIHRMTKIRLKGGDYKTTQFTSKDVPKGPQHGAGFDPVYSYHRMSETTGPLRRKGSTTPEDHLNLDEAEKWMEAKHAAKVLGLKEKDLSTLTHQKVEEAWRSVYRERTNAQQNEVLIAAEVLLEYLDSTTFSKKNKQYYRKVLDNARLEIDLELSKTTRDRNEKMIYFFGFLIMGASALVIFIAYSKDVINGDDLRSMGTRTQEFFLMTFMQPKNVEPPPDYSTRYFNTPTASDLDQAKGLYEHQFSSHEQLQRLEAKREYDRQEEAALIQMLNEENEKKRRMAQKGNSTTRQRVLIHRPEDLEPQVVDIAPPSEDDSSSNSSETKKKEAETKKKSKISDYSFKEFLGIMSHGFGGGSRMQRLTAEPHARAEELYKMQERMNKDKKEEETK